MGNELHRLQRAGRLPHEAAGIGLPVLIAAGLFLAIPGDSRSQGERREAEPKTQRAPVCDRWHRGSGASSPLDLGVIQSSYGDLKKQVAQSLDRAKPASATDLERSYDAGLPACRGEATRTHVLPPLQASRFRGKLLYFVSATDLGRLDLPPEIEGNPSAEILVVQAGRLAELPEVARRLGRPVSLASSEFAKALGVRCANTWLKISEKGDGSELHEAR